LTGPSGSGKTATIEVLAKELGIEILEWLSIPEQNSTKFSQDGTLLDYDPEGFNFNFYLFFFSKKKKS